MKFVQTKPNNNTFYNSRYRENFDPSVPNNGNNNDVLVGVISVSSSTSVELSNPACMSYTQKRGPGFIGVL